MPPPAGTHTDQLVGVAQVLERIPISEASVDRAIRAGAFPRPVKIGRRRLWRASDISNFIATPPHEQR